MKNATATCLKISAAFLMSLLAFQVSARAEYKPNQCGGDPTLFPTPMTVTCYGDIRPSSVGQKVTSATCMMGTLYYTVSANCNEMNFRPVPFYCPKGQKDIGKGCEEYKDGVRVTKTASGSFPSPNCMGKSRDWLDGQVEKQLGKGLDNLEQDIAIAIKACGASNSKPGTVTLPGTKMCCSPLAILFTMPF